MRQRRREKVPRRMCWKEKWLADEKYALSTLVFFSTRNFPLISWKLCLKWRMNVEHFNVHLMHQFHFSLLFPIWLFQIVFYSMFCVFEASWFTNNRIKIQSKQKNRILFPAIDTQTADVSECFCNELLFTILILNCCTPFITKWNLKKNDINSMRIGNRNQFDLK